VPEVVESPLLTDTDRLVGRRFEHRRRIAADDELVALGEGVVARVPDAAVGVLADEDETYLDSGARPPVVR
jgi:hypothetical protein